MRLPCAIAFCRGTFRATAGADEEGLCERHWALSAGPLRQRYEAAWAEATRCDEAGIADVDVAVRVTSAWRELLDHARELAAGEADALRLARAH